MSRPLSGVLQKLQSADPAERRSACRSAAQGPAAVLLAEGLAEALGDPDKTVARAASDALVEIGQRSGGVEEALRKALQSDLPQRRWGAAFTSARLEPAGPRLLPAAVEALASPDGDVRWAAARLIVEIGRLHAEVLPLLLGLVRGHEQALVRRMATFALRELAPDRGDAARALLEATRDADLQVRRAALTAVASLADPPSGVVDRLLEALREDEDAASRRLAVLALGEIGRANPRAVSPVLARELREAGERAADPDLRRALARALERISGSPDSPLDPTGG